MKYKDFEDAISPDRMRRYVSACANDTKRAMVSPKLLYGVNHVIEVSNKIMKI
jgi:hypothetical protein